MTPQQQALLDELGARGYPCHVVRHERNNELRIVTTRKLKRGILYLAVAHDGIYTRAGREYRFRDIRRRY